MTVDFRIKHAIVKGSLSLKRLKYHYKITLKKANDSI